MVTMEYIVEKLDCYCNVIDQFDLYWMVEMNENSWYNRLQKVTTTSKEIFQHLTPYK